MVSGKGASKVFENESGGHRFQRVSPTEKRGRIHTSTITVAVLDVQNDSFELDERDLEWSTTRGSGAGGQNRNKVETVAVVKHLPTGLIVRSETERSQYRNKELALKILKAKLQQAHDEKIHDVVASDRKQQIGSGMRGDKRRTIRVKDDTVKDHVTGQSWSWSKYKRGDW